MGVDYGANHFKKLEHDQIVALKKSKGDFDINMIISTEAKEDLQWWMNNTVGSVSQIRTKNPDCAMTADASNIGWGAVMDDRKVQGQWDQTDNDVHINVKELLAIEYGLEYLAKNKNNCVIHVITDNTTAVAHINKMGGVRSINCMQTAYKI